MPTFARTGSASWHVVGSDGCRFGRAFVDTTEDSTPDETVTATDIIAYDPVDTDENDGGLLTTTALPTTGPDEQRLVLPEQIEDSDGDLCGSCESRLEGQKRRRDRVLAELKWSTSIREADWTVVEDETGQACDWCRARERTVWQSDVLRTRVCPACGRLFGTDFGDPPAERAPETDRLPETPASPVTPVVFGISLPDHDPTELTGSNRPMVKYREKSKYAEVVFDLERTGHAFSADGIAALEAVRDTYVDRVADDDDHQTSVRLDVGRTPRTLTLEGIFPADGTDVLTDARDIASDPACWFPLGWPQQGYLHRREATPSIPGKRPVVEEFPRLETQAPDASIDTGHLESVTESGRYARGERYYERGAVTDIERVDDTVSATVQGSRPYDIRMTLSDGQFVEGECDCPDDAVPCKHVVAAVLASGDVEGTGGDRPLGKVLADASPGELRDVLSDIAEEDITVRKRLYEELE